MRTLSYLLLSIIIYGCSLSDSLRIVPIGSFSLLGLFTLMFAVLTWLCWLLTPGVRRSLSTPCILYSIFLSWAALSLVWSADPTRGLQNLTVQAAFFGAATLSAKLTGYSPSFAHRLQIACLRASVIAAILYGVGIAAAMAGVSFQVVSPRAFALFSLIGLAQSLSMWRYGNARFLLLAIIITSLICLSLSRAAFAVSLLLYPLAQKPSKGARELIRLSIWTMIVLLAGWMAVHNFGALNRRFFTGDLSLRLGGVAMNASGRTAFWNVTVNSLLESRWTGKGAGSSQALMDAYFPGISHPHNDYLRIVHDYGFFGLLLFLLSYLLFVTRIYHSWRFSHKNGHSYAAVQLAALLVVFAIPAMMTSDNAMVYVFVMAPAGVLIGSAAGLMEVQQVGRVSALPVCTFRRYEDLYRIFPYSGGIRGQLK